VQLFEGHDQQAEGTVTSEVLILASDAFSGVGMEGIFSGCLRIVSGIFDRAWRFWRTGLGFMMHCCMTMDGYRILELEAWAISNWKLKLMRTASRLMLGDTNVMICTRVFQCLIQAICFRIRSIDQTIRWCLYMNTDHNS